MNKKWYNYFVSVNDPNAAGVEAASEPVVPADRALSAAQSVAEIAGTVAVEPKFSDALGRTQRPVCRHNGFTGGFYPGGVRVIHRDKVVVPFLIHGSSPGRMSAIHAAFSEE